MSSDGTPEIVAPEIVTPSLLREWGLPSGGSSKHDRGSVLVVGGAARSPGAAMLAGVAALRVGAGRLGLAIAHEVAAGVAVAVPESGIAPIDLTASNPLDDCADDLRSADAVVLGPGLDDVEQATALLVQLPALLSDGAVVVLDAFALGALAQDGGLRDGLPEALILTPNPTEAGLLLGRDVEDAAAGALAIADEFGAVVACQGEIADADGTRWSLGTGHSGLGTSGSGDVLAGAVGGIAARGVGAARSAVWGSHLHAVAGDRLTTSVGPTGYLARELLDELPRALAELSDGR